MSILAYFSYPVFVRALVACLLSGGILSLVGIVIVVLNLTTMRFALMHIALLGSAIALILSFSPIWGALLAIACGAWFLGPLSDKLKIDTGLSSALFMTGSLALAFFLFYQAGLPAMEAFDVFSGNILALSKEDIYSLVIVSAVVLILVVCFYREIQLVLYNSELAETLGIQSKLVRNLMLLISGLAIGVSMRLVGALLVDAIILLPALGGLQLGSSLVTAALCTSLIGLTSTVLGLLVSLYFNWPLGVTITLTGVIVLLVVTLAKRFIKKGVFAKEGLVVKKEVDR